ncbi:MAG: UDP-glucose 4-epimerase [Candidatus Hydrogenedentota bacterium]
MSTILVTGGAGFIGSHVVDAYVAEGHRVVILDDLSTGKAEFVNPKAVFYRESIASPAIAEIFDKEKPDVVNHLAAQIDVRKSVEQPLFDAETNVLGSLNLLECCVKYKVGKLIFASTGGAIYGEVDSLPVSEAVQPHPISHYGAAKFAVENYIFVYGALYGLKYTILRFPNVYGPRQNPHGEAGVCSILVQKMLAGEPPTLFGFGDPIRDYVFVGDIARGCVLALDKGDGATVNLGSCVGTSVRQLFDILKSHIGFKLDPVLKPIRPGEIHGIYITGDRARETLGWIPQVSLEDGLAQVVDYVRHSSPGH